MKVAEGGMSNSDEEFWVMWEAGSKDEVKHTNCSAWTPEPTRGRGVHPLTVIHDATSPSFPLVFPLSPSAPPPF